MTVHYSHRNGRDKRAVSLLRALDLTGQISWHDETSKNSITPAPAQLSVADGRTYTGYPMIQEAMKALVFGRTIVWMLWIPGVPMLVRYFIGDTSTTIPVGTRTAATPASTVR